MLIRFAVAASLSVVLAASTAAAGDYADRDIIGFSPDGLFFAFEEYGVQDGSGFPFSNIYVLDTLADAWVEGTPIRALTENEEATLDATRRAARARAAAVIDRLAIGVEGDLVVSNPMSELSADPHRAEFLPELTVPPSAEGPEIRIRELPLAAPGCPDYGERYVGFDLTLRLPGENRVHVLHRDTALPPSRGCALGYRISDVVVFVDNYPSIMVVLISVLSIGFEGPNRRFIAVSSKIDEL